MINTMGIIYTTKDDLTLREMTASRAGGGPARGRALQDDRFCAFQHGQFRCAQRGRDHAEELPFIDGPPGQRQGVGFAHPQRWLAHSAE